MKKIKIFGIFMSIMIIASCFVSTISVNAKNDLAEEYFKIQKSDKNELATYLENQDQNYDFTGRIKDDGTTKTVQLTDEELQRLYAMIDSVEDAEVQIRLQNVLDNSLDGKGEIELNALGEIAIITYDYVSNLPPQICPDDESMVINTSIPSENMISSGTSTYFYPEFWDNFDYYDGWGAYGSYSGSNKYTGAVAVISDAWVGYGRAEARQRIQFYIGSTKTITITGETLSAGGNANLPPAAVAGSDITLIFNNDAEQFWFNPIDEAFGYEWFEGIILWFFQALFPGSGVTRIDIIIDLLMTINSIIDWAIAMNQLINAQSHTITHSFTLEPGWYTAGVGIRSISSGCVVGHAMNGRFGDVEYIKVDGIASPDTPNVHGDAIGYVGIPYEISFSSEDPNEDDVQYKIDWGDGDISDWSDFFVHNTEITGEHTYLDPGYYTIRVKARDRDLMESDDWGSYEVHIIYPDTEAPETWIDSGPSGLIDYNDNIEFTWSGWDAVTPPEDLQYSYKLVEGQSGGTWSSWTSSTSKTYNDLSDNTYTFLVKAIDLDFNEDPTPASRSFTIYTGDPVEDDWPILQNNNKHTGYTDAISNIIFPEEKWRFEADDGFLWGTSAVIGNLDSDNNKEIIIGDENGRVYCIDRYEDPEAPIWTTDIPGDSIFATAAIGNVLGDNDPEVLISGDNGYVYCLDGRDGYILWTSDPFMNGCESAPVIGYVDTEEIKVIVRSYGGYIHCFSGTDGTEVWYAPHGRENDSSPLGNRSGVSCSPAIGNVDGGDDIEVIAVIDNYAYCFRGDNGEEKWSKCLYEDLGESHPTIGDLDNDGNMEIVFVSTGGYVFCLNGIDGSEKWQEYAGAGVDSSPAIGNVDSDSTLEVIVATRQGKVVCFNGNDGSQKWISDDYGDFGLSSPAIVDIDGDGDMEIIVVDRSEYNVKCFEGNSGDLEWETEEIFTDRSDSSPAIGDIDNDEMVEIIVADEDGNVVCIDKGINDPPVLSNGGVNPSEGSASTTFDFSVHYYDANGHEPAIQNVVIDDTSYPMSGSGSDSLYTFSQSGFSLGNHHYYFYFEDGFSGTARLPPFPDDYSFFVYPLHTIDFYTDPSTCGDIWFDDILYSNGQSVQKRENTYNIYAMPDNDYEFDYWITSGGVSVADQFSQSSIASITGDGSLTAHFTFNPPLYTINFETYPSGTYAGSIDFNGESFISGESTDIHNGTYPISANPETNFCFDHWSTFGGIVVDDEYSQVTQATVNGDDGVLSAHFETNFPPNNPTDPIPYSGAVDVDVNPDLSWNCSDPDIGDIVTYDVYFGTSSPPSQVMWNQTDLMYSPETLEFETIYYWQIVAWDNHGASTIGDIWSFATGINYPPYEPSNPGPPDGASDVPIYSDLSWIGGDLDPNDIVTYDVYFGTTNPPPQVVNNQSSTIYSPEYLDFQTNYYWRIVAWDQHGMYSEGPLWSFSTEDAFYTPFNPSPSNGSINISIDSNLGWWCDGTYLPPFTLIYFDIYYGVNPDPPYIDTISWDFGLIPQLIPISYDPATFEYSSLYYWKIVARDTEGRTSSSQLWEFTTEESPAIPDLDCDGSLGWTNVEPGATVTGSFTVENIGDPGSPLDWQIDSYPTWGLWTLSPSSGNDLTPEDGSVTIQVEVVAPYDQNEQFNGEVKIVNTEDISDYCIIPVSLATSQSQPQPCFLAGTKISMADGSYVNIEAVNIGDLVKSYDVKHKKEITGIVTKTYRHEPDEMSDYYIVINNKLCVTPNHDLYMDEEWIKAGDVKVGDSLSTAKTMVSSTEKVYKRVTTYDLEVQPIIMGTMDAGENNIVYSQDFGKEAEGTGYLQGLPYFVEDDYLVNKVPTNLNVLEHNLDLI